MGAPTWDTSQGVYSNFVARSGGLLALKDPLYAQLAAHPADWQNNFAAVNSTSDGGFLGNVKDAVAFALKVAPVFAGPALGALAEGFSTLGTAGVDALAEGTAFSASASAINTAVAGQAVWGAAAAADLAEGTAFSLPADAINTAVANQPAWGSSIDLAEGTAFSQPAETINTAVANQPAWGSSIDLAEGTAFSQSPETINTAVAGQPAWGSSPGLVDTLKSGLSNVSNASKAISAASTVAKLAAGHTATSGLNAPGGFNAVNQGMPSSITAATTGTDAAAAMPGWVVPALIVAGSVLLAYFLKKG